jgi:hypothetical protein
MDLIATSLSQSAGNFREFVQTLTYVWYIMLPPIFFFLFKELWMWHIQERYWLSLDWMLLEIIPPKNIEKSPKSMEALYVGMAGVEKSFNPLEKYVQGAFADAFSLEMVSDGGEMHLYVRTMRKYRHLVEAHLYAQYPDIVINEVPDYVFDVPKIVPNTQWNLWGTDWEFVKHTAYPIKTYQHFEESVTGKMIDPMAGLAEAMSKLPPGQKLWLQIIVSPHSPLWAKEEGRPLVEKLKGNEAKSEGIFEQVWTDIYDVFSNLFKALSSPIEFAEKAKKDQQPLEFRLTTKERDIMKEVEEKLGKLQYRTKIRMIYIGRREGFDKSLGVSTFVGGLKQFNDDNLNSLRPNDASKTYANYILTKPRERYRQRKLLRRYRNRSFDGVTITLNTEELATLFHLPDMQVAAPSLARAEAKRGGAPTNLPID